MFPKSQRDCAKGSIQTAGTVALSCSEQFDKKPNLPELTNCDWLEKNLKLLEQRLYTLHDLKWQSKLVNPPKSQFKATTHFTVLSPFDKISDYLY